MTSNKGKFKEAKQSRKGKRRPGTQLISYPAPQSVKDQLVSIAQSKGIDLSKLLRQVSANFIRRHNAAKRKGAA